MKKLTKKQAKKLLAIVGTSAAISGVGAYVTYNSQPHVVTQAADVKAKVQYKDDATFKKGSDIAFDLYAQVPYDSDMSKLMIYDKLEPVFTHTKTRVFDGDKDITDQGTLDFDKTTNTTNWLAKDPKKWFGKKLTFRVEVNLKDNADLSKYLDKNTNQYNIPNTGDMVVNDKTVPSNTVHVHTPNDKEPTAVKTIRDKNGKDGSEAKYQQGDEFHYTVKYTIPKNGKDLTNVEFSDDLEDVLDLKNVKVTDDKGNDITKQEGTLTTDDNKESFNWQPNKDYLAKMADHEYTVDITAQVKNDADLTNYLDKASQEYQIPNTAHMKYNNKDIPSNEVHVSTPPPTKDKVTKSVKGLSGDFKNDSDNVEVGKDYTYKIDFEPAEGKNLKDVEFSDDLEDVLDLEKVQVLNPNGKDVTDSEGTLKTDDKNESFIWQPKDDVVKNMGGKKYSVLVTAKVKEDADLQKYLNNNEIIIPNTAYLAENGEKTPSNKVTVKPKTDEPSAKKGIVKNPSDWAKFFGTSASTAAGQTDEVTGADKSTEPKAWAEASKYVKKVSDPTNPDGYKYEKANDKVTDEQFKKAVASLKTEQPITDDTNTGTSVDTKSNGETSAPTNSSDLKSLISASTVESNQAKRGDAVDYLLTFDVGNQNDLTSLVLSDNLEDVLDLKNVVVIDSDGNNITNDGQMTMSQEDESFTWTAKDPKKYSGKKIYVAVASNIKEKADLTSYDNKAIPNVGHMSINGKDTPTNEVKTTLNGNPDPKKDPNNPDNPNNNPITGKNGLLPQTGHFIMQHVGWIVGILAATAAGLGAWLFKKNKEDKELDKK